MVSPTLISNSTIGGNSAVYCQPFPFPFCRDGYGGGIANTAKVTIQNSVVAYSLRGGNSFGTTTSHAYNLSSDRTCNFSNSGDRNSTDPMLGPLQYNGGPPQTMALLPGSHAIDAGNPSGCTDSQGHLLKTDQRGQPRPDKEDKLGCDMGAAYERQSD